VSNGVDRIYFISTETHPRNYNNSIFSGYIENGQTFDMDGNLIDADIFDNGTAAGGSGFVSDVTDYTLVQQSDPLGEGYNRLWTTDMALDSNGQPMALFTSRWNPDGSTSDGSTSNIIDHRLHFAHWNPTTQSWDTQEIAKMGDRLYGPEQDYTGLGALIPGDENTLYISTLFDPRDPTWQTETEHREIYKGVFNGSNWDWTAITENSSVDNLRPIAPDTHGVGPQTVFWFRGDYNTAGNINAAVVGIVDRPNEEIGLVTYLDANATNTTFANGSPLSTTGPSATQGADDNQWHERTGFGNGGSVLTSNESGTENAGILRTTIDGSGLEDGTYDIFAYFWSDNDEDWRLLAGLEQNNLMDFRLYGSQYAEADQFESIELVTDNDNDLQLYRAYLGRTEVVGGADIDVLIDDWQTINGSASRTWYDGVGYALISELASLLVGDYNENGVVDAADYTVWRDALELGTVMDLPNRDPANTGLISEADFISWRNNFGNTGGAGSGSSAAVPEPSTGTMLVLVALVGCITSRRRLPIRLSSQTVALVA